MRLFILDAPLLPVHILITDSCPVSLDLSTLLNIQIKYYYSMEPLPFQTFIKPTGAYHACLNLLIYCHPKQSIEG